MILLVLSILVLTTGLFAQDWSAEITVTGETGSAPNVFTNIIGMGAQSYLPAPPPPPQYMVWTELYDINWMGPYSQMIAVAPSDSFVWIMRIDPNGNVAPPISRTATVTWDASSLPTDCILKITDLSGAVIVASMQAQGSFTTSGTSDQYFYIVWTPIPPEPEFNITPESYDFGTLPAGQNSDPMTFTISNVGNASGSGTISLDNMVDFSADITLPYIFELGAGESLDINITFNAQIPAGMKTGELMVNGDDPANDISASLQGTTEAVVDNWSADLTVTGEAGTAPNVFTVTIGVSDAASLIPAPPAPPSYMVWTELYDINWAGPYYEMIYEFAGDSLFWILSIDPNGNMMPPISRTAVVTWDSYNLPTDGEIYIIDTYAGTMIVPDMRAAASFSTSGTSNQYFTIVDVLPMMTPPDPENLVISNQGTGMLLTWTGTTQNYIVYKCSDPYDFSAAEQIDVIGAQQYLDNNIGAGPWFYQVVATTN